MRTTAGLCIHCSQEVEWDESLGRYVSRSPGGPALVNCGGVEGSPHQVDDELAPLPPSEHEGNARESDDGHTFTGWCSCGWEGDPRTATTPRRNDDAHGTAHDDAMGDLSRHFNEALEAWLDYTRGKEG